MIILNLEEYKKKTRLKKKKLKKKKLKKNKSSKRNIFIFFLDKKKREKEHIFFR